MSKESHFHKWLKVLCTWEFLFEFIILIIHPIPFVEKLHVSYILNMTSTKDTYEKVNYFICADYMFALMFMRFYFLIRTLMNFTIYSDLFARKACAKNNFAAGVSFYIKALMNKRPAITIVLTAVISVMWLSYLLRIFER
jgi:hypothetical protein